MKKKILYLLFLFLAVSNYSYADVTISGVSKSPVELTAAVPLLKIRQGEKFKLFDGVGAGLKWSPFINDGNKSLEGIHLSGLVMVSSSTEFDKNTPEDKDQIHILSAGIVIGYHWLEIGIGRDLVTSESKDTFDAKEKSFYMLNLGANIQF